MRERILIRNADAVVTCDPADRVLYNSDILICGNRIEAVGNAAAELLDLPPFCAR